MSRVEGSCLTMGIFCQGERVEKRPPPPPTKKKENKNKKQREYVGGKAIMELQYGKKDYDVVVSMT